jgi:RNA polymerase sigma factor (sigma-70 family)
MGELLAEQPSPERSIPAPAERRSAVSWPSRASHPADEALIEACLSGDQSAWSALVARYKNLVYSVPVRYRLDPDDAADVFQKVWLALFSELPNLRHAGALRSCLLTVAAHQCYQLKRKAIHARGADELPIEQIPGEFPPAWLKQAEKEQAFREAIAQIPERCQKLVRMLFYEDPPPAYADVAARLGLAEGSIGFTRRRCLNKLRTQLERIGF